MILQRDITTTNTTITKDKYRTRLALEPNCNVKHDISFHFVLSYIELNKRTTTAASKVRLC
jgi:hypothetical protein